MEDNRHLSTRTLASREHVKNISEPNTDAGTQNETYVFCVDFSFAHTRTDGTLSWVGQGEHEGTSKSRLHRYCERMITAGES